MIGSAMMTNEAAYLFRKFGAYGGPTRSITKRASAIQPLWLASQHLGLRRADQFM